MPTRKEDGIAISYEQLNAPYLRTVYSLRNEAKLYRICRRRNFLSLCLKVKDITDEKVDKAAGVLMLTAIRAGENILRTVGSEDTQMFTGWISQVAQLVEALRYKPEVHGFDS
jgi:hypothetical protein